MPRISSSASSLTGVANQDAAILALLNSVDKESSKKWRKVTMIQQKMKGQHDSAEVNPRSDCLKVT